MTLQQRVRAHLMTGVCALSVGAVVPSMVWAADAAANGPSAVGEVVVTAQKRSENIQNVPIAVSALGTAAIQQRGVQGLTDLQNEVAGLKFGQFSGAGNISIRGVGTAFVSGAGQSSVALYVDGIYLSQPKSFGMVQSDISDIEVLKGPQGTLYGRNSTGGVINFTTAAPTRSFSAGGSFSYGNYSDTRESGYVSGPITDKLRARLYIEGEQHDGYVTNDYTGQKLDNLNAIGGRFSLDADLTDRWKAELRISTRREECACVVLDGFDPKFALVPAPYNDFAPYRVTSPVHYAGAKTDTLVSLKNTVRLTDSVDLVSITGFNDFTDGEIFDTLSNSLIPFPLQNHVHVSTITQELELNGNTKRLKWIAGFYYFNDRQANHSLSDESSVVGLAYHSAIGDPATSFIEHTRQHSQEESESIFGDATYEIVDGTRIYGGARVTYDRLTQALDVFINDQGTILPSCFAQLSPQATSSTALTGRLGLQHDLSDDSMGYVQYSRGYKSSGFSQSSCNNPYAPETVDAVEAGYKSRWLDRKLTLNMAAFYYNYANFQLEQATLTGIPVVNAPKSHVYGLEITALYRPVARLRFDGNLELLQASYDQFISQDPNMGVPVGTSLRGVQLDNAPTASGTVGVEFDQGLGSAGSLTLRSEVSLTTSYHLREFNVPWAIQKGYALSNFTLTYYPPDEHYQLRAFVKNATNITRLAGVLGFGGALGVFQPPRTYGVEASVKF